MPQPVINGIGIAVHKTKKFNFTIKGDNISVGDSVKLVQVKDKASYQWDGCILSKAAGDNIFVAEVTLPPAGYPGHQGDLGEITITVTNADGTSLPHVEIIVIDEP